MATAVISQIGQQTPTLPFYQVVVNSKKYVMGCDGNGIMVFKGRQWLKNLNFSDTLANTYQDVADSDLVAALGLNASGATTLDGRFPAQATLTGSAYVEGFDPTTGWSTGYPKISTTPTSTTTPTTTTTGGSTTGTTTTTGGGTTSTTTDATTSGTSTVVTQATSTVTDFLTTYWWAIALVAVVLLWKPVIAPALGMDKRRRR